MQPPEMPEPALTHDRHGERLLIGPCFTAEQMRSFFELGYKMGREDAAKKEQALWDLLDQHGISLSRAYIRDASGRWDGWWGCGPKVDVNERGSTMREAAEACAAAIRGEPNGQDH
jgi:hypothetical protein